MSTAAWYLRRLRSMGPDEVVWRFRDAAAHRRWAKWQVRAWPLDGPPPSMQEHPTFERLLPAASRGLVAPEASASLLAAADRLLRGDWEILGVPRRDILDPDWFHDEVTGVRAPSSGYAFSINHRDEASVGNIKALWEVSRHHHLTVLAAAWWLTEDDRYAAAVDAQLRSWWQANPFLSGVHWTSGIEIAIRLISWTWARRLLGSWPKVEDLFEHNEQFQWQLWWHQRYLARFRSRGTSANNHVIAEAAGQLVAASAFPWFAESADWHANSLALLEAELHHNTFPSGVNRELATEYHGFVTELGLVAAAETAAAGQPVSDDTWSLLGRSLDVAAALVDVAGNPPRQGDGDDGRGLLVDAPEQSHWGRVLHMGASVMGAADWWPQTPPTVAGAALSSVLGRPRPVTHLAERPDRFDDAGIVLLRSGAGSEPELWCRCDSGPHGFLAIAAHAHADALSVEFRHDGVEILADPGTYCYHGEPEWRAYFRSTLGHNTLEVGGGDQSVSGGPFLWTRHARTRLVQRGREGDLQWWVAEHDGYGRTGGSSLLHRRSVLLDDSMAALTVEDRVSVGQAVSVRLAWHLGPRVEVELDGQRAHLTWPAAGGVRSATMELAAALTWSTHRGELDPVLGWYSHGFGRKEPATTLIGEGTAKASSPLITRVVVDNG
jgi:hypothetical protein